MRGVVFLVLPLPKEGNKKRYDMKVMIPINKNETGKECVANGFHNARMVCVYDYSSSASECMASNRIYVNSGNLIDQIKEMGIEAVISSYLPPMTLRIFEQGGITVFRARGKDVEENIDFLKNAQLEYFSTEESREMWNCESGCSSCNSKSCA